jgi:hypothetical protein
MTLPVAVQEPAGVIVDAASAATITFTANVTAGNSVKVMCARLDASGAKAFVASDCTKSAGTATIGTITLDKQANNATTGANAAGVWTVPITGSGSLTVRVGGTAGSYFVMDAGEYTNADTVDGTPAGAISNTATTPAASGTVTSTDDALFIAVAAFDTDNGNTGQTVGNGFTTLKDSTKGDADLPGSIARKIVSGAATTGGTWAWTTTLGRGWSVVTVAYKASGGGGTSLTVPTVAGISTVSASLGRNKAATLAANWASATTSAALGRKRALTAAAIHGVATATATLGRMKAMTLASAVGHATASAALGRLRTATLASVSGSASVASTLHAIRRITASTSGTSSVAVTLAKLVSSLTVPAVTGAATVSATLHAKRALSAFVASGASVAVTLGRRGFMTVGQISGTSSVAVTLAAIRASIAATVHGTANVTATLGRQKAIAFTSGGSSNASVTLTARRSITVRVDAGSTVNLTANARRVIAVSVSGSSRVSVAPETVSTSTTTASGKYRSEHDAAVMAIAGATGFGPDHAGVLRDLSDAGV